MPQPKPKRHGNCYRGPRKEKPVAASAAAVAAAGMAVVEPAGDDGTCAAAAAAEEAEAPPSQQSQGSSQSEQEGEQEGEDKETDSVGSSKCSSSSGPVSGAGDICEQRGGLKRGREEDEVAAAAAAATTTGAESAAAAATVVVKMRTGPKVEVRPNDEITVDGKPVCAPGDRWYSRLFGIATMEKHMDPEWKIGNGLVDRCYYRGPKSACNAVHGMVVAGCVCCVCGLCMAGKDARLRLLLGLGFFMVCVCLYSNIAAHCRVCIALSNVCVYGNQPRRLTSPSFQNKTFRSKQQRRPRSGRASTSSPRTSP